MYYHFYGKLLMDNIPHSLPGPVDREDEAARFDIANRLFLRLYQSSNLMHKTGTRAVAGFGATTQQWAVMGALARPASREAGLTVKELIAFLMVSRQNLTAVIDRLVAAGLVERLRTDGDGRLRHVRLTAEGSRQWEAMGPDIRSYYKATLSDFSTQECVQLFRLLDRLRDSLHRIAEPD